MVEHRGFDSEYDIFLPRGYAPIYTEMGRLGMGGAMAGCGVRGDEDQEQIGK